MGFSTLLIIDLGFFNTLLCSPMNNSLGQVSGLGFYLGYLGYPGEARK